MRWFHRLARRLRERIQPHRTDRIKRFRRLIVEQYEDRRMLAVAVDDSYVVQANTPLTDNSWSNDSYNASWEEGYWNCTESVWHEGYWEATQVWHDEYWENPEWFDGYWDENNEWHDGYWSPPEPVWHDGYWETVDVWHDGYSECISEEWVVTGAAYASGTIDSGPSNGTLSDIDGAGGFTYTPNLEFSGMDSFTYSITDDQGTSTATVTIDVDFAPVAVADSYTTDEDTELIITAPGVLANDTDADQDDLTAIFIGPTIGNLSPNPDGSFTYTPAPNFHGADTFGYWANDGLLDSSMAMVTITVNSVNDAPIVQGDFFQVIPGTTTLISDWSGVLTNDNDVEGDQLSALLIGGPVHGSVSLYPGGGFLYIPDAGYEGDDAFTYSASDGSASSNSTVLIDVGDVDGDSQIWAVEDTYSVAIGTTLLINSTSGVLANDIERHGGTLSASVSDLPSHGTLSLNANGSFTYVPDIGFSGIDSFEYMAANGEDAPATAVVNVRVGVPSAVEDEYLVAVNTPLVASSLGLLANDIDPAGISLSATLITPPQHGELTLDADGTFTYTPHNDYSGPDTIVYEATNGLHADTVTATFTVSQADQTFTIGLNQAGASAIALNINPPDSMGAVGPTQIVEMTNASVSVYNKVTGALVQPRNSPVAFWNAALQGFSVQRVLDQRVIFDLASGRWFACAIGIDSISLEWAVLIGVSSSADATSFWKAFLIDADPTQSFRADYPLLGVDAEGVYIHTDLLDGGFSSVMYVPKSDLLLANPTIAKLRLSANFTGSPFSSNPAQYMQPVVDFAGVPDGRAPMFGSTGGLKRSDIIVEDGPGEVSFDPIQLIGREIQRLSFSGTIGTGSSFSLGISSPTNVPFSAFTTQPINYPSPYDPDTFAEEIETRINDAASAIGYFAGFADVQKVSTSEFDVTLFDNNCCYYDYGEMTVTSNLNGGTLTVSPISNGTPLSPIPPKAQQPSPNPLLETGLIGNRINGTAYKEGNSVWLVYNTNVDGRAAIVWAEIDDSDSSSYIIRQIDIIKDPQRDLYYPSIAVNSLGDIVIGMSASSATEFPSSYVVVGHTINGETTFGDLTLLRAGSGGISTVQNGRVRFGDYSATVRDPSDPYSFWTFQEYTVRQNVWGVSISQIVMSSPANRPTAASNSYQTNEDTQLIVPATGILANDTGPSGVVLTAELVQRPLHGSLVLNTNGGFTYMPDRDFVGFDVFTYMAASSTGLSNSATVSVFVAPVNDQPVRTRGTVGNLPINEDAGTVSLGLADLAYSPGGGADEMFQTLTFKVDTLPSASLGTIVLSDGITAVTANTTYLLTQLQGMKFKTITDVNGGPTTFKWTVEDNGGTANGAFDIIAQSLTISITPVNDAPVGTDNTITMLEDNFYILDAFEFGFADPKDQQPPSSIAPNTLLWVKIESLPVSGLLTNNGFPVEVGQVVVFGFGSLLQFTPASNANGNPISSFTFRVQDNGTTDNGGIDLDPTANTITLNVTPVNDAPAGTDGAVTTLEDTDYVFSSGDFGFGDANDVPSNSLLNVLLTVPPASLGTMRLGGGIQTPSAVISVAAINISALTFLPATNLNGAAVIAVPFMLQDDGGTSNGGIDTDSTANTITINVTPVNDAPTLAIGADQTVTDESLGELVGGFATAISAGPPDESGQTLTFEVTTDHPEYFRVQPAIDASGNLTYRPAPNVRDVVATVTVALKDNGGTANGGDDTSDPQTFTITITKPYAWHNTSLPLDVNADGFVTQEDVDLTINYVNVNNGFFISPTEASPDLETTYYFDTDADHYVSPNDALIIINFINAFVGGTVYFDRDGNGKRDITEYGIEGVVINLKGDPGHPISSTLSLTATSDDSGQFVWAQEVPGSYNLLGKRFYVKEVQPPGYVNGADRSRPIYVQHTPTSEHGEFYFMFFGEDYGGLNVDYGEHKS